MIRMRWTAPVKSADRESGVSTVEVVLLTPLIVFVLLVMVALGMMVNDKGDVGSASADAARMGSLQRDRGDADTQAQNVADSDLAGQVACSNGPSKNAPLLVETTEKYDPNSKSDYASGFTNGALYQVTLSCSVNYFGFTATLSSTSISPIDQYRETN